MHENKEIWLSRINGELEKGRLVEERQALKLEFGIALSCVKERIVTRFSVNFRLIPID